MTTDRARLVATAFTSVILPMALLTALTIGLGFLVTHVLVHVWPFTVEDEAVRALVAARTATGDRVSNWVSLVAYRAALAIVVVVAGCAMRIAYHRWREPLFLPAALVSQGLVYLVTSPVVARARPAVLQLDSFPPMRSFPSGHVAAAVAVYGGLALILAQRARGRGQAAAWWIVLLIVPMAVGISRMYRGEHHASDVAASFLVGFACLWIWRRAILTPAAPQGSREP